jgi:hypothetical protein
MKLPNAAEAEVPEAKIIRYLLNPNHRSGKSKAQFFLRHGFRIEEWAKLATALRQHASENEVTRREPTPLGERFVIDGLLALPDGSTVMLRVVWFIETGETIARLATAYPVRSKRTTQ